MTRAAAIAVAVLGALALPAHAGAPIPAPPPSPPDRSAIEQAGDANFDEDAPHHGFVVEGALGLASQTAFGVPDATGFGGGASLRFGARAGRHLALLFAFDSTSYLSHKGATALNTSLVLSLGAQIYVRDAIWVRLAAGLAGFNRRQQGDAAQHVFSGPGGLVSVGYELLTFHDRRAALSLEVTVIGSFYAEGFVGGGLFGLGLAYQ